MFKICEMRVKCDIIITISLVKLPKNRDLNPLRPSLTSFLSQLRENVVEFVWPPRSARSASYVKVVFNIIG